MIGLQRCTSCGGAQYPPREFCGTCLTSDMEWERADQLPARVLARTLLHHSNEPRFRASLPLAIGLVRFDAGPVAICFLSDAAAPGDAVQVRCGPDDLLRAG